MPSGISLPSDPGALIRSRPYRVLLVIASLIGLIVSVASWGFLELVHEIQVEVYEKLPGQLGFDSVPAWWPLPWLALAGLLTAIAIERLPGRGGHIPAEGLKTGGPPTKPVELPGVLLAAGATLGLGLVLGPEAPLIGIGAGVAVWTVQRAKQDAPPQLLLIMGAAGSFAAISVIFGSPIVAAVLVIEAAGLGGPVLPLILIPGLIAAGVGSLVFIGMANWTGLSTSAYSLSALQLPHFDHITWEIIGWTIVIGLAGGLFTQVVRRLGLGGADLVPKKPWVLIPLAGVVVAALAILFAHTTTHGVEQVLFSGQEALPGLVSGAGAWSLGALAMVLLCKGLAWSASLSAFRGGPTFPAIYLGAAGGIMASHLPGMSLTPAVAVGMAVMLVSFLKLPLSSVIIATSLTISGGLATGPLIIIGMAVAYLTTLGLEGRLGDRQAAAAVAAESGAPAEQDAATTAGDGQPTG